MEKAFVARHQIQNMNGKIEAYELLFRGEDGYVGQITSNLLATSKVLLNVLTHMNFDDVIEGKRAFINVDQDVIFSGILSLLNPKYFVIELLETTEVSEKLIVALKKLRKQGFEIALDDFDCTKKTFKTYLPIMPYLDYIKFDIREMDESVAVKFLKHFQKEGKKVIAEKVENIEEYHEAMRDGYNLFQGFYFRKPEILEVEVPADTSKSTVLHLISLIKDDKEVDEIEKFAKNQPDLVYNLLKYLNSPSIGVKMNVGSLKQAINLLGRDKLLRWLLLYLYSDTAGDKIADTLLNTALKRATSMEQLADRDEKDRAFLTGMFSLLDVLFNTSMDVILRGVPLENSILSAITTRSGHLGKILQRIENEERDRLRELVEKNFGNIYTGDIIHMLQKNGVPIKEI